MSPVFPTIRRLVLHPALWCALAVAICVLLSHPFANMGLGDDFSYIWSARVFADTGHIAYNGWGAMMLGWQLYWGALFIKLFGFSFNTLHTSGLILAMATAALTQRVFVRAGLTEWNATIVTLCLTLSPLFFPLCFSFMSDVPGFLSILVCLYGCLRALQAKTDRAAIGWLIFAGLSNAVGGTARQIAWLGVLVMVPSAAWTLRQRHGMLAAGAAICAVSVGFVAACMEWFKRQPYSLSEKLITRDGLQHSPIQGGFTIALYCLPILVAFLTAIPFGNRRARLQCAGAAVLLALAGAWLTAPFLGVGAQHELRLAPFDLEWVTARGFYVPTWLNIRPPAPPVALLVPIRLALTLLIDASLLAFLICLLNIPAAQPRGGPAGEIPARTLFILLGPFTAAYALLSGTRAWVLERYYIPLILVSLLALVRWYQSRIASRLPVLSVIFTALFAGYAVAQTHDFAAGERARLQAIGELGATGIPHSQIKAGIDYDGWTELEMVGHANDPRINTSPGAFQPPPPQPPRPEGCMDDQFFVVRLPAIQAAARYELTYQPTRCFPESQFSPLPYTTWLLPHRRSIYILDTQK